MDSRTPVCQFETTVTRLLVVINGRPEMGLSLRLRSNYCYGADRGMDDKHMDREESNISLKIEDNILHVTVEGSVTLSDIVTYAQNHIEVWARSPRMLWDLRRAVLPLFTSEALSGLLNEFREVSQVRAGGHTAIVVRGVDEQAGHYLVGLSKAYNSPVEYQSFVDLREARRWLQSV